MKILSTPTTMPVEPILAAPWEHPTMRDLVGTMPPIAAHVDADHDCCAADVIHDWMNLIAYGVFTANCVYIHPDVYCF